MSIKDGDTPLLLASYCGHLSAVNILLEMGADPFIQDNRNKTALDCARQQGRTDVVNAIEQHIQRPQQQTTAKNETSTPSSTPLQKTNSTRESRNQPIHAEAETNFLKAAESGDLNLMKELTTPQAAGQKPQISFENHNQITNQNGQTALHLASRNRHLQIINYLLQNGVDVNVKNADNCSALHFACEKDYIAIIQALLTNGAEMNQGDRYGFTPLHVASLYGNVNAVEMLLTEGADPLIKDHNNRTAIDLAKQNGHNNVANVIQQHIQRQQSHDENVSSRDLLQNAINHPESSDNIPDLSSNYILQCTNNLERNNFLGGGTYGKVYLATDSNLTMPKFAIKVFDFSNIANPNHKKQLIRSYKTEAATLKRFRHPNIITLYGTCNLSSQDDQGDKFSLVMEYANKGSLDSFLKDDVNRARLTADIRISIMFQLARSIHFLHTGGQGGLNKVLHRDIKPSNICLTNNFQVKIIDCGLAKLEKDQSATESKLGSLKSSMFTSGRHGPVGTRGYMCPNYERTNTCVEGSDVFSLGVVFAELIIGCLQGGQATRNGKVFGLMWDTYVWDTSRFTPIVDGDEQLVKDADTAIVWNPNMLQTISKIAIECMTPTLEQRKTTLNLVNELNQILGQALLERTTIGGGDDNQDSAGAAISNLSLEDQDTADAVPCYLCTRNIASKLKCNEGHAFCRACACAMVAKHLDTESSSFGCCVSGCKSKPFSNKQLQSILPVEFRGIYRIMKKHNDFMREILSRLDSFDSKMESVHQDVKDNKDLLRGISNKLTRSVMALGALTVRGAKLCPNLVWMVPTKVSSKTNLKKWFKQTVNQTYEVVFVCQHSWEVTHEPFEITVPRRWVAKVAPLLKFGLLILKKAVEVHDLPFPDLDMEDFDKKVKAMEEFVDGIFADNDDDNTKVLMANASAWVSGEQQHDGAGFSNGQLSNLLGPGLELIRERAYRPENLVLWSERIVPVPLREQDVDSLFGFKWVKKRYKKIYYA